MIVMDNGTMIESFKFLNYCQLAKGSLVSNRYWNLIRSHRHKLALFDVDRIYLNYKNPPVIRDPVIKMFNEELSPGAYNEWIVRNGYSKQISLEVQIAEKESAGSVYVFGANVYQNSNHDITTNAFRAHVELEAENWPLFQHFIRLLMDPFIYIRILSLNAEKKEILSLLARAMNPDRDRLRCKQLNMNFNGKTQESIVWVKDNVRCDEFKIYGNCCSNYDEELLDLFLTGAPCTSTIYVTDYDLSEVIIDLVQKFMARKNSDECQLIESIRGYVEDQEIVGKNFAEFFAEEEQYQVVQYEEGNNTRQVVGFINNEIEKELMLSFENVYFQNGKFSIMISNP